MGLRILAPYTGASIQGTIYELCFQWFQMQVSSTVQAQSSVYGALSRASKTDSRYGPLAGFPDTGSHAGLQFWLQDRDGIHALDYSQYCPPAGGQGIQIRASGRGSTYRASRYVFQILASCGILVPCVILVSCAGSMHVACICGLQIWGQTGIWPSAAGLVQGSKFEVQIWAERG